MPWLFLLLAIAALAIAFMASSMAVVVACLLAAAGTGFTFLMTTLGAAMVFYFRKSMSGKAQ